MPASAASTRSMTQSAPSLLPIPFSARLSVADGRLAVDPGAFGDGDARLSVHSSGGTGAVVFGRLCFLEGGGTRSMSEPAGELLERWKERGDEVLQGITGEFLLALWDIDHHRALFAVDRFATYPLYWAKRGSSIGVSARPAEAAKLADLATEPDWQSILAYVYFHVVPAPSSVFAGVNRLDVGHALRVSRGNGETFEYWTPTFDERRPFVFSRERELFLDALRSGVAECSEGFAPDRIGCFLSGGTDSSTIAGLLTRQQGAPARTFAIGFDVDGYDESRYSRLAAQHFGTQHTEYFVTADDVGAALEAVATQYEQPFGNSSALPTFLCARLAREAGIERMLGGDGGDELYGGNERYAKQAVFDVYRRTPKVLRGGLLEPLLFGPLKSSDLRLVAKARSYVEQANEPLPDRIQSRYNLINHLGASRIFTDTFLARVELSRPLELEREVWARARSSSAPELSQLNRFLAWDFKFTLGDSDLPKVTRMCNAAGVDVAFPMLTHALVEHSLRLRPSEKLRGTRLRHFFKESLRGFLPDEILAKPKHGFGLPFGAWVLSHSRLRSLASDALRSLSDRAIVRPEFLRVLLHEVESGHAGYYGTMVWILVILELWLRASPLNGIRADRS